MRILPPLYPFEVAKHVGANPDREPTVEEHFALLPHELFATLALSPETFDHLMGSPTELDAWWRGAALAAERAPESAQWLASARAATANAERA